MEFRVSSFKPSFIRLATCSLQQISNGARDLACDVQQIYREITGSWSEYF